MLRPHRLRHPIVIAVVSVLWTFPDASGQIARFPPPSGAHVHSVIPGERYRASGLTRWLLGSDYRELWTSPLDVPVLDLDSVGGGLTPVRTGGFGQSVSLHFDGADGRRYIVRSLDKDPSQRLMPELKGTLVETIVQDLISALHPTGALVVDPILEATNVLYARHRLLVIPDDARLGEFRSQFAGMAGMLVLHPDEGADATPGFAGSRRIIGTDQFLGRLEAGPCDRVDAEAFLTARMVDMLVGDRDRHAGQWRWARYPDEDCRIWRPIPEDRDQAFVSYDGLIMWAARLARPQQITFGENYPNLTGLTFNAWELDRQLLVALDGSTWDSVAIAIQRRVTDSVIDNAVLRLPLAHRRLNGERLSRALRKRRDDLVHVTRDYYRLITRWAEIKATDEDEWVALVHDSSGNLEVSIGRLRGRQGARDEPYFTRTFRPDVTKEVRLYLRGGDDKTDVRGNSGRIAVRIDGGGGDDEFINASDGSAPIAFYDSRGKNAFELGRGAHLDESNFDRPPASDPAHQFALDWGGRSLLLPTLSYNPDVGASFGLVTSVERYGYRKTPFKTRHALSASVVSNGPDGFLSYDGRFRSLAPRVDGRLMLEYSGITILRFNGLGNETTITSPDVFYRVQQRELRVAPTLSFVAGRNRGGRGAGAETLRQTVAIELGPILKYADTPIDDNADRYIATVTPAVYGTGGFGQVGARLAVELDSRDNSGFATRGFRVTAAGSLYPAAWDVQAVFGEVHGAASAYLTAPIPTEPTLAVRVGGKKVWGTHPFHEAAYLGGDRTLRGYRSERFGGEAAAYANTEVRFRLTRINVLVPADLGLFGLADVGRVFHSADPDDADTLHSGFGGGIWFSFIDRLQTISVAVARGDDLTGVYVRAGFLF